MKINGIEPLYPIIVKYATKNPCYKENTQITVTSEVLHSIGCNQPSASNMQARWDRTEARNAVTAVCDDKECYIMLPCEKTSGKATRNWGVGKGSSGYSNNSCAIQIEMCESKWNKYVNAYTVEVDKAHIKEAVEYTSKCLDIAIEFLAQMAVFHKIDVLGKDKRGNPTLMSHIECNKHGVGSAHSDIGQLEKAYKGYLDLSMDTVRKRVAKRVEEIKLEKELMEMTDAQFDKLMSEWISRQNAKPVSNWAKQAVDWANKEGYLTGNEKGQLMGQGMLTREQMASVLYRYNEKNGKK